MSDYRLTRIVQDLPATVPFVGPETLARRSGVPIQARLGANESVLGPSPLAIVAMQEAAGDAWMYGDPEAYELRTALAEANGVERENIVVGVGIDGLFGTAVRLFVEPGTPVVSSLGAYPTFAFHVAASGGVLHTVPYRDDYEDLEALAAVANTVDARLVYLANPDNPMGTCWDAGAVTKLRDALPADAILVLDEAYYEFASPSAIPTVDATDTRTLRFRTFSKAHGLAGARVGYVIGHAETIAAFDRVRDHFGVGRVAQAAALASLRDLEHVAGVVRSVAAARVEIAGIAEACSLSTIDSSANFVAVDCGRDGDYARRVLAELGTLGVFVRMPSVAPLDRCIRITAGTPEQLAVLAQTLPRALHKAAQ
jgi:histidinol-phosphate aminotransferase